MFKGLSKTELIVGIIAIGCILVYACLSGPSAAETEAQKQEVVSELTKAGVSLPADVTLLKFSVFERDPAYEARVWILYTKGAIKLPPAIVQAEHSDPVRAKEDARYIELYTKWEIANPKTSLETEWELDGFRYRGTLVTASDGTYFRINRLVYLPDKIAKPEPVGE